MGCNADYVLDKMQWYEVNALLKYRHYKIKDNWEQSRLISYLIAQVNTKKTLKLDDIISFEWEKEKHNETIISKEEIEALSKQAEEMEQKLKQNQ